MTAEEQALFEYQVRCPWLGDGSAHALLELMYGCPEPMRSREEYQRFTHEDLQGFTRERLIVERDRLWHRLLVDKRPDPWLVQRHEAIDHALAGVPNR